MTPSARQWLFSKRVLKVRSHILAEDGATSLAMNAPLCKRLACAD